MWRLALLLVATLALHPLTIAASKPVAIAAAGAFVISGVGLVLRSTAVLAAGVALALLEYALALTLEGGPPRLGGAVLAGVAVALTLEVAHFDGRFRRLAMGEGVLTSQFRYWGVSVGLGALAALALVVGAIGVTSVMRLPWAPVIAALGALAAIVAAAVGLRRAVAAS